MTRRAPGGVLLVAAGIHTLTDRDRARALVVDGERIAWVGHDPAAAPPTAGVVDLGSAWVTPAFVDAHVHGTATGLAATGLDLSRAPSGAAVLRALAEHAAGNDAPVILGHGWDDFGWPARARPTAAELSEAAPGRTVMLTRVDGHSCLVDAATLADLPLERLAGVDRDSGGQPTGWLREHASEAARQRAFGRLPAAQLDAARHAACGAAAQLGIGSFHEMGHPGLSGWDDVVAWRDGSWPVEVLVWWAELDAQRSLEHGLRPGGDLFLDGSIGSGTAAVSAGYAGGGRGELFHSDEAVEAFFVTATRAGAGAGVHAIGDEAIAQALAGIEAAAEAAGATAVRACRHRIEHVELPERGHLRRMARLGVVASVQPGFDAVWGGSRGLYAARFGAAAAARSNPLAWFAEEGVPLAFGSDSTVTPLGPWSAVVAAERHQGGLGLPRGAALAAHTLGGRHVAHQRDTGPLAVGRCADLAVWDGDPLAVEDPRRLQCLGTVVRGRAAHGFGDEFRSAAPLERGP